MTVTGQIKILERKIKQNESLYDLDREAAKISALSSNNLDKYELLTGEDLGLKPSTIEQAKFEYSPLGKIFNNGLSQEDKKEGVLKRLKYIEDKNKVENKVKNKDIIEVTDFVDQPLNSKAKELINEIKTIQKNVDYRKLKIRGGNNVEFDFSDYKTFKELFRDLYYKKITIDYVERKQDEITGVMGALKRYAPRDNKYVEAKNKLVNNVKNFNKGREKITEGFKNGVFPVYYGNRDKFSEGEDDDDEEQQKQEGQEPIKVDYKTLIKQITDDEDKKDKEEQEEQKPIKYDYKTLIKQINDEEKDINNEVFKKYFKAQAPSDMLVFLKRTNDTEKKNELVNLINSGLKDLKEEIKKMSKEEIIIEKPDKVVNIVEKILKFNEQNQQGEGIKILTPNQMLNRLPVALAQLQAGNNSNKLKNEIRQLLYSLYRSKNMTEQVYKSLIGNI